jgi:hypothetical protein
VGSGYSKANHLDARAMLLKSCQNIRDGHGAFANGNAMIGSH